MRKRLSALLGTSIALLLATGCGGAIAEADPPEDAAPRSSAAAPEAEADDAPEPDRSDATPEPVEGSEQGAPATVRGVVRVDGVGYDITEVRRCEPLDDGTVDRELELQGLGEHEGGRVQIDVYVQTVAGVPSDDIAWSGPEGVFGNPEDTDVVLDADGAEVRGTTTLMDAMTHEETVAVDFELEVPAENVDCR